MYKSKKYSYEYEEYEDGDKSAETMVCDILADSEFAKLEEIVIGDWGDMWEEDEPGAQDIIDDIVENKERFSHIKSLTIGEDDSIEISWIVQGNYKELIKDMPQLEKLTIFGSFELALGKINAPNLQTLEIICGGLPKEVIQSIRDANLPALKSLTLYIGVEDYGFDGTIKDIEELLEKSNLPVLENLAIVDSEIQDEICKAILDSKYMKQINRLELSMGTLTDKGGQLLLDKLPEFPNVKCLDVHYHYLSDIMIEKLEALPIEVNANWQNEPDKWNDEIYYWAMLTE